MNDSAPASQDKTCSRCGLSIGQVGSFTYWIFKEGRCQCDSSSSDPGRSPAKTSAPNIPGNQLLNDRYELVECVGRGAMGYVYKGLDVTNGQYVALKLMRPELSQNELAVKRLMREVAVVSSLSHSNLGMVHGYGQEKDGLPYLVMDFVEGQNLADIIKTDGPLKPARALEIFIQIAAGLDCAHLNGVIHRDIKPSNVIVQPKQSGQDRAVIVDFGFARILRDANDSLRLTQEGEAFGSPAYMSPEQCMGEPLDARSDLYSFGCLMYEALTGAPPLVGENVLATVAKQVREKPVSMRAHDHTIQQEIDEIVMKCLAKEPVLRYQKASDLRIDLDKLRHGSYVNATSKRAHKQAKTEVQPVDSQALRGTESIYQQRVAVLIAWVLLAAVLIGGMTGGIVWLVLQQKTAKEVQPNATTTGFQAQPPGDASGKHDQKSEQKPDPKPDPKPDQKAQQKPERTVDQRSSPKHKQEAAKSHPSGIAPHTTPSRRSVSEKGSSRPTRPRASSSSNSNWAQLKDLRNFK
jgi:serine/threonine protein kinase